MNKLQPPDPPPGPYIALTEAGEAVCWGWNNYGQAMVTPGRYTAISAGESSTCAHTEDGEAVCWGWGAGTFSVDFTSGPHVAINLRACLALQLTFPLDL